MFDASFFQSDETATKDDAGLFVVFTREPMHNEAKSQAAGRAIFDEVEMVRIVVPGAKDEVVKQVTDVERKRFAAAYARFQAGDAGAVEGTPLEEWPALAKTQVFELRALNIRTVEQLAGLSDTAKQRLGLGANELVARAQAFLAQAKDGALAEKLAAENVRLKERLGEAEAEVRRLAAIVATLKETPNV